VVARRLVFFAPNDTLADPIRQCELYDHLYSHLYREAMQHDRREKGGEPEIDQRRTVILTPSGRTAREWSAAIRRTELDAVAGDSSTDQN